MSTIVQEPVGITPPRFGGGSDKTRILFVYERWDDKRRRLCEAIIGEDRYDVTSCPMDDAVQTFSSHDVLITDRGSPMPDPLRDGRIIFRGDNLIRQLKVADENPGLRVMVASDLQDPMIEYPGRLPLSEQDRYYNEELSPHVDDYFKYPFHIRHFLVRLRRLDTNFN